MKSVSNNKISQLNAAPLPNTGLLVAISAKGEPIVDFPGNPGEPVIARTTIKLNPSELKGATDRHLSEPLEVLLAFEQQQADKPIVTGVLSNAITNMDVHTIELQESMEAALADAEEKSAIVDGKKIALEAHEEIQLKCGKSSVTLKKNGRIIIKGTEVLSRASRTNKIRGGSVAIN